MTQQRYKQVAGGTPDPDEQHEARTFERKQERFEGQPNSDLYMMTEIADGVFVQWLKCHACSLSVGECKCQGGPVEAPWLASSRETRMQHSFGRRGAKPALPESTKEHDRVLDAAMRELIERGYTITPPARKVKREAAFEVVAEAVASVDEDGEVDVEVLDKAAVQTGVDSGLTEALRRAQERAKEDADAGF